MPVICLKSTLPKSLPCVLFDLRAWVTFHNRCQLLHEWLRVQPTSTRSVLSIDYEGCRGKKAKLLPVTDGPPGATKCRGDVANREQAALAVFGHYADAMPMVTKVLYHPLILATPGRVSKSPVTIKPNYW